MDEKGTVQSEESADVRSIAVPSSRLSQVEQRSAYKLFGRLMHGAANLVLPDQLHAATPNHTSANATEDDAGCTLLYIAVAAAEASVIGFGVAVGITQPGCPVFGAPGCLAFFGALAAEAASLSALATAQDALNTCVARNSAGSGSGNPSGSGSGTNIICNISTQWYMTDEGVYVTNTTTTCVAR